MIETAEDQMEASCPEEKTRIKFGTSPVPARPDPKKRLNININNPYVYNQGKPR